MTCRLLRSAVLALAALALPTSPVGADERSTARRFEEALRDEPSLITFLRAMPKGGDLHIHAGGSLYAEHGLREAVRYGLFFNPKTNRFEAQQAEGAVPAGRLMTDAALRYCYLEAATLFKPVSGPAGGHDHFFGECGPLTSGWQQTPDEVALAGIVRRARMQNLQYVELTQAPGGPSLERIRGAVQACLGRAIVEFEK